MGARKEDAGSESSVSEVAKALKRLRGRAGLSVARMASALGMSPTTYQHYEDRYKKPKFEPEFLTRVFAILRRHGVTEDELAELGAIVESGSATLLDILDELRKLRAEVSALRRQGRPDGDAE